MSKQEANKKRTLRRSGRKRANFTEIILDSSDNSDVEIDVDESLKEQEAAMHAGLPPTSLSHREKKELPKSSLKPEKYITIRNSILYKWRKNYKEYLTKAEAMQGIRAKYHKIAATTHDFLTRYGYINTGIFDNPRKKWDKEEVIVIGAGASGLAAASQLHHLGYKVTVLEARDRVGGRANTDKSFGGAVDMGAMVVTGIEGNPVVMLCEQLGLPLHELGSSCNIYNKHGELVDKLLDESIETKFNNVLQATNKVKPEELGESENGPFIYRDPIFDKTSVSNRQKSQKEQTSDNILDHTEAKTESPHKNSNSAVGNGLAIKLSQPKDRTSLGRAIDHVIFEHKEAEELKDPPSRALFDWHVANLEYACASELSYVSLRHWDQDDQYEFQGAHCLLPDGYGTIFEGLAKNINIKFGRVVKSIEYTDQRVKVKCLNTQNGEEEEMAGDICLVTLPLGVLAEQSVTFTPELPTWKTDTISRMGFGLLNKIGLLFPNVFWENEKDNDYFGVLADPPLDGQSDDQRGNCFMFWNLHRCIGKPVLLALVAGGAAFLQEDQEESEIVKTALEKLRGIYPDMPEPLNHVVTKWHSDPFARGSYSYISVNATGEDYDVLAMPVSRRLFFAGEATQREHPATVAGAFLSGLREAGKIDRAWSGPLEILTETKKKRKPKTGDLPRFRKKKKVEGAQTTQATPKTEKPEVVVLEDDLRVLKKRERGYESGSDQPRKRTTADAEYKKGNGTNNSSKLSNSTGEPSLGILPNFPGNGMVSPLPFLAVLGELGSRAGRSPQAALFPFNGLFPFPPSPAPLPFLRSFPPFPPFHPTNPLPPPVPIIPPYKSGGGQRESYEDNKMRDDRYRSEDKRREERQYNATYHVHKNNISTSSTSNNLSHSGTRSHNNNFHSDDHNPSDQYERFTKLKHSEEEQERTTTLSSSTHEHVNNSEMLTVFRKDLGKFVVKYLKKYFDKGKISSKDDFKHLARKFTHLILEKEKKQTSGEEKKDVILDSRVKKKAIKFVDNFFLKLGDKPYISNSRMKQEI